MLPLSNMEKYIRTHLRFNVFTNLLDGSLFGLALGFASFSTIILLFVSHLTDSAILIGLFAGILFGVLLELATIRQLQAYEYGQFLVMVLDVPLGIGVAWGCIL